MSEQSRKVKNPLLTAAGQGFPFEGYATNALLMPVTPATPAILQDTSPDESSVANESISGISNQQGASTEIDFPAVQEHATISQQIEPGKGESNDQPTRQSYFTSILSSLPNLSLSSITGDSSSSQTTIASQQQSGLTNTAGPSRDSYGFSQNPYPTKTTSGPFVTLDQTPDNSGQYSRGFGEIGFSGPTPNQNPQTRPPLNVPTLPPSGGPGSYRLGNQRRLKYAPPPDLTSNNTKQYPAVTSFLAPSQQTTSGSSVKFLNPNASVTSPTGSQSSPGSLSSSNFHSGIRDLHDSRSSSSGFPTTSGSTLRQASTFSSPPTNPPSRSSHPVASNCEPGISKWSVHGESSLPREIPSKFPETATPRNTPANSNFSGFVASYATANPSEILKFTDCPKPEISTGSSAPTRRIEGGLSFDVPISAYSRSNVIKTSGCIIEPTIEASINEAREATSGSHENDDTFAPISAAKVTARLQNLLDERKEVSSLGAESKEPEVTPGGFVDAATKFAKQATNLRVTAELGGSTKPASNLPPDIFATDPSQEIRTSVASFFDTTSELSGTFDNSENFIRSEQGLSFFFDPGSQPDESLTSSFPSVDTNFEKIASSAPPVHDVDAFHDHPEFSKSAGDPEFLIFPSQIPTGISGQGSIHDSCPSSFAIVDSFATSSIPEPSGSATLNPVQTSVNPGIVRSTNDTIPPSFQNLAAGPSSDRRMHYRPVYHHWFYRKEVEGKVLWLPFTMHDSLSLEEIHNSSEITTETIVATDGGRYDVDILRRCRNPVYWTGNSTEVRRSSWFYKGPTESRYVPYEESTSARLEEEYKQACITENWNRRVELNNGEYIIFHSSMVQVHHMPAALSETAVSWGSSVDSETGVYSQGNTISRPRIVKRGVDEFNIDEGEPEKVDHLLFLVHGIGSVCDLKFRTVEEVVDEFRSISLQLVQSHYRTASMHGVVNRIEVLPISWHTTLHSDETGIDKKLRAITLESIPKLRHFTNDTLLDILFYTSPKYCQTIMQTVGGEMNRLYALFNERNRNFSGSVYLGGHSLGSLILFDLLCHQKPPDEEPKDETTPSPSNFDDKPDDDTIDPMKSTTVPILKRRLSKKISYVMGAAGTGQPFINYPQLSFLPRAFFALGSPIGMFVTVRGIDTLGEDFAFPTCPAFFNVFHPFDPVAYRVESLINPEAQKYRPMLIPHHKGRKRMHLELKETMARVGADLKQKLLDSVRSTWNSVYHLAMFHRSDNQSFEQEIEKVVEEQLQKSPSIHEQQNDDDEGADFRVGKLNGGRRIDYVLQEAPFEYINEYIFALTSHVCYWESEDTMLMMLKEIYGTNGVQSDAQLPSQTMTIERISSSSPSVPVISGPSTPMGYDPTAPPTVSAPFGPPPISGFVRKS